MSKHNKSRISDEEIDRMLLANMTQLGRKVARVVGTTMLQIDPAKRIGLNDLYFARRVSLLAEKGFIEYEGNLNFIGRCEVRLRTSTQ